ncbi:LCP family protein [Candidatus Saccharibacteria bacterium]|nr:LCP family protein [Candidatus Saccharibacteria bacterium]
MVKEEKTIDGFPVRRAEDSALVAKSKAKTLSSKKQVRKTKTVTENDPLVKKNVVKITTKPARVAEKQIIEKPTKKVSRKPRLIKPKKRISRKKMMEMFTAEPEAFNIQIDNEPKDEIEILDEEREFNNEIRDERLEEELFGDAVLEEAHEEFLAPVETFDFKNASEDEGQSRVNEMETIDVKQSKRELKESQKRAELERKRLAKAKRSEKKRNQSKAKRIIKWVLVVLLVLILGAGIYLYFWGDGIIKKITGGNGDIWSAISAVTTETYDPLKTDGNGRTNILVYGTSGFDTQGTGFDGYQHDGADLTDSIMVVSLDQETGDVAIVSLPRDLYAKPTCTATGKINEVYYCAMLNSDNEADGAAALQAKIKTILGIDTQYYVHMNWGALQNIVDAVGGVTIVLDEDIEDYYYTGAVYSAGVAYNIGGADAVALSRARHGTSYGDFSRANSQQKILIGIKNKVVEKGLGLSDAVSIISALGDNLRMDFSMAEIKTGMHLLETLDLGNIRQIPLMDDSTRYMTYGMEDGISYIVPSAGIGFYTQLHEYLAQQLKSNPAEREGAVIIVYNGSGKEGVAAQEQAALEGKGFRVKEIANAPEGEYKYTEEVEIYDASEGLKPDTKKALEKYYGLSMKSMSELPNGISPIGYDFIIIMGGATE